jgi:hypothetical protein
MRAVDWVTEPLWAGGSQRQPSSLRCMQRPSWRTPVRWCLIAVAVLSGLFMAMIGDWWLTASLALLVAYLFIDVGLERRKELKRNRL